MYQQGLNTYEIAELKNCAQSVIMSLLQRYNVKTRTPTECHSIYTIDETYFETIDTPEKAQILGFIYADGCHYTKGNQEGLIITIAIKDLAYLEEIKKQIQSTHPVYHKKVKHDSKRRIQGKQTLVTLSIPRKKIGKDLNRLGVVPRKSLILQFPTPEQVPLHFMSHFFRGYLEGDGWITITKNNIFHTGFCSSEEFCKESKKYLTEILDIGGCTDQQKNNKIWRYRLCGNKQIIKFLDWIYKDSPFVMERKYKNYLKIKEIYNQ